MQVSDYFFENFYKKIWWNEKKVPNFALAKGKQRHPKANGSLAQLNRASDYGSEGCRFESCRSHLKDD